MKKRFQKSVFLAVAAVLIFAMTCTASAAGATVTFRGKTAGFDMGGGSGYTATDLFSGLKDVMPGDRLTDTIVIQNSASDCAYIKLYLKAVPLDEKGNPLTYSEAYEAADGNDQAGIPGQRDETIPTMADFLAQLTMRVYDGAKLISESTPEKAGALAANVLLGTLEKGQKLELRIELDVPATLGDEYAHRVGEVNWVFTAECFDSGKGLAQTGQRNREIWLLGVGGAVLFFCGLFAMRRKETNEP